MDFARATCAYSSTVRHCAGMQNTQRLKLIAAAIAAAAYFATERAQPAPVTELCLSTLSEIQRLAPQTETACMLRAVESGMALSFTTSAPLLEDPIKGKAYISFLFGSLGKSLNNTPMALPVDTIQIVNPALLRSGQAFQIQVKDLKALQRQASKGSASVSSFYEGLILHGRLVRTEN